MASKDFQVRYYENDMPRIGDVVMVKVVSMTDTSCYVRLLEYDNIEGMIPYTELSRRRIRSISQQVKVGKLQVAVVIRLDEDKKYIDLSKKQVTPEERKQCEERFKKAKAVASIACHTALEVGMPAVEVMRQVAWPLYKSHASAYDALKLAVQRPEEILKPLGLGQKLYDRIVESVQHKLKPEVQKIQAEVNVTCFTPEGVDAVRDVLLLGQSIGQQQNADNATDCFVQVHVLAPPTYLIYTTTEHVEAGVEKLMECIEAMKAEMAKRGGQVEVPKPPHAIGLEGKPEEDKVDSDASDDE